MKVYFRMFGFFLVCRMAGASHQGYVIPTTRGRVRNYVILMASVSTSSSYSFTVWNIILL